MSLSVYAFTEYGHDAKLYNGIADLERQLAISKRETDGIHGLWCATKDELVDCRTALAEAQQALTGSRITAHELRSENDKPRANRLADLQANLDLTVQCDTLRGLLHSVPHDSNCHSQKEHHLPGMIHYITDSDDERCPPFHFAKGKCNCHVERITAVLKEVEAGGPARKTLRDAIDAAISKEAPDGQV